MTSCNATARSQASTVSSSSSVVSWSWSRFISARMVSESVCVVRWGVLYPPSVTCRYGLDKQHTLWTRVAGGNRILNPFFYLDSAYLQVELSSLPDWILRIGNRCYFQVPLLHQRNQKTWQSGMTRDGSNNCTGIHKLLCSIYKLYDTCPVVDQEPTLHSRQRQERVRRCSIMRQPWCWWHIVSYLRNARVIRIAHKAASFMMTPNFRHNILDILASMHLVSLDKMIAANEQSTGSLSMSWMMSKVS